MPAQYQSHISDTALRAFDFRVTTLTHSAASPYTADNTVLFLPSAFHGCHAHKEISLEELKDYPCIVFDQSDDSNFYLTEEAMADYDFVKTIKTDDRATTMEIMAELLGYSVGCGMLSAEDAILQGLVSIKLKEEDPLIIGYIIRKGSTLTQYGKAYIEELMKYKEF